MKIQLQDLYYGAVLSQIAEHPTFTTINKIPGKQGLFEINAKRLLIKYTERNESPWHFSFQPKELDELAEGHELFIALVCGTESICLLEETDAWKLLSDSAPGGQRIKVVSGDNIQFHVTGPGRNKLPNAIPHKDFPGLFIDGRRLKPSQGWAPFVKLNFYRDRPGILGGDTRFDRMFDLEDHFTRNLNEGETTAFYMGVSTIDRSWKGWDAKRLECIEKMIREDINADGCFRVTIKRITGVKRGQLPPRCSEEFIWKIDVTGTAGA
jgi:hypothetical protein